MARLVERHFGGHQDIEWAIARDGTPFMLQSRPVTTGPEAPAATPRRSALSFVMATFGVTGDAEES